MLALRSFVKKQAADLRSQVTALADGDGGRQRRWCRRISLLMLAFPIAVLVYGGLTGHHSFFQIWNWPCVRNIWVFDAAIGILLGVRAAMLARWSKDDGALVLLHFGGVLFIWIASFLPYVGHPD